MSNYPLDAAESAGPVTTIGTAPVPWSRLARDGQSSPSDFELLTACRAGDPEAWEVLVERYERLVFSVALRNGVTREEAADITQMTFIALLESIEKLREEQRVASWLMSVARRLAWRQRRRSDRETPRARGRHPCPMTPSRPGSGSRSSRMGWAAWAALP